MQPVPRLFFNPDQVAVLRQRIAAGQPTASAIYARALEMAGRSLQDVPDEEYGQYAECCAIAYLVGGEAVYAKKAHAYIMRLTAPWTTGELRLAHWALAASIVSECCRSAWTATQQAEMTRLLIKLFDGQREVERHVGNPHDVTNNHWAVSHSGAALAAMAAHGQAIDEAGTPADMTEAIAWARGRVAVFLNHHGDRGLYHEGLGYMAYPASLWLPAVIASRNFDGTDFVERFPNIREMAASLYASACARPCLSDEGKGVVGWGMKLSWNDDGPGWMQSNVNTLLIHLAHAHHVPALRWMYDRLSGTEAPEGQRSFSPGMAGWFFTLLYYPYDTEPVDPDGILPRHLTDSRQGLSLFRNRYRDGDDAILGCYARATFVGGHAHDDAGSLRLMALGHDWMMGGGQARPKAEFQSVVMPADGKRREPFGLGSVIWDQANDSGGVLGMDLRKPNIGYCERYVAVDYSGACGSPVALAILDQIDDHLGRDWHWNMTYEPGLRMRIHDDRAGFTLLAGDGATLSARFLGARPVSIERRMTPDSHRTYQSGVSRAYPGRPYVQARFAACEHLGIYIVLTIQRGDGPPIRLVEGLDARIGSHVWRRPFGAAIPAAFRLGATGGLCKYPAGVKNFRAG